MQQEVGRFFETMRDTVPVVKTIRDTPVSDKPGYIKVRLTFLTFEPVHVRSLQLQYACGARPPFNEDICILMKADRAYPDLEHYSLPFEQLKTQGLVSTSARLTEVTLLDEDVETLSYIID